MDHLKITAKRKWSFESLRDLCVCTELCARYQFPSTAHTEHMSVVPAADTGWKLKGVENQSQFQGDCWGSRPKITKSITRIIIHQAGIPRWESGWLELYQRYNSTFSFGKIPNEVFFIYVFFIFKDTFFSTTYILPLRVKLCFRGR